jgi:hypothetical protein
MKAKNSNKTTAPEVIAALATHASHAWSGGCANLATATTDARILHLHLHHHHQHNQHPQQTTAHASVLHATHGRSAILAPTLAHATKEIGENAYQSTELNLLLYC